MRNSGRRPLPFLRPTEGRMAPMKRFSLLVTVASMLVAAMPLSRVAQAAPISDKADAQCAKLAIRTLGTSFNPSNYAFHGGTEGNDDVIRSDVTDGPDL